MSNDMFVSSVMIRIIMNTKDDHVEGLSCYNYNDEKAHYNYYEYVRIYCAT